MCLIKLVNKNFTRVRNVKLEDLSYSKNFTIHLKINPINSECIRAILIVVEYKYIIIHGIQLKKLLQKKSKKLKISEDIKLL